MVEKENDIKLTPKQIGDIGEHYIAYELGLKGCIVDIAGKNNPNFDLYVCTPNNVDLRIQVKTHYGNNYYIDLKKKDILLLNDNLYFALLKLNKNIQDSIPEYWIIPSIILCPILEKSYSKWLDGISLRGKTKGNPRKDNLGRRIWLEQFYTFPDDWQKQLDYYKFNINQLLKR